MVYSFIKEGFEFEQIITAHRIYKFDNTDYAVEIMMKDEHGKIHHNFLKDDRYSSHCKICNYPEEEHPKPDPIDEKPDEELLGGSLNEKPNENDLNDDKSELKINIAAKPKEEEKLPEFKSVSIPQDVLDLFEEPDLCYICCAEKVDEQTGIDSDCNHLFCKSCVVNHLTININNGKVLISLYPRFWILNAYLVVALRDIKRVKSEHL